MTNPLWSEDAWNQCLDPAALLRAARSANVPARRAVWAALSCARAALVWIESDAMRREMDTALEHGFAWLCDPGDSALKAAQCAALSGLSSSRTHWRLSEDSSLSERAARDAAFFASPVVFGDFETDQGCEMHYDHAAHAIDVLYDRSFPGLADIVRAEAMPWQVVADALEHTQGLARTEGGSCV